MEDLWLRERVCTAMRQLWMRGLVAGDGGLISVETHRRRFLVTPPGKRRSDLAPEDLMTVDIGGMDVNGGPGLAPDYWRLHRLGHQIEKQNPDSASNSPVKATVSCTPPALLALLERRPETPTLTLPGWGELPVLADAGDEPATRTLLDRHRVLAVRRVGLLAYAGELGQAMSLAERCEHAATVALWSQP